MSNARRWGIGSAIAACFCLSTLQAAVYDWDGGGNGLWDDGNNWTSTESDNTAPQSDDEVRIGSATPGTPTATATLAALGATGSLVYVGHSTTSNGRLVVTNGTLNAVSTGNALVVGHSGAGLMVLSNGTVAVTGTTIVGNNAGRPGGRIEVVGGSFASGTMTVANKCPGIFVQEGGAVQVGTFRVGRSTTDHGRYELKGGELTATTFDVGFGAPGTVRQTGGSLNIPERDISLGRNDGTVSSAGAGTYELQGGHVLCRQLFVGREGLTGTFHQTGGTNTVTTGLYVAYAADGADGAYNLWGGALVLTNLDKRIYVGHSASGQFNIGTVNGAGEIREALPDAGCDIEVRNAEAAVGVFRGWGAVRLSGYIRNNGKVVADGYGVDRDLDLSTLGNVMENQVANTTDNGWYAQDGGRLLLPAFNHPSTTTWGDGNTQDLVNSVKFNLSGSGGIAGALVAADHASVPAGLPRPLGVWQFSTTGSPGEGTLTFRYDDPAALARNEDEGALCVLRHDGTGWSNVTDGVGGRDLMAHTLRTVAVSPAGFYAIVPSARGTVVTVR